jgi:hypothetical protein
MTTSSTYENLIAACAQPGCPVCRVARDVELRYLDRLFYEQVNDYNSRVRFRASIGFCAEHAQMACDELSGKSLGLAILYEDLLRIAQEQIEKGCNIGAAKGVCPGCAIREETLQHIHTDLTRHLLAPELSAALRASQGLCFPHFRSAFDAVKSRDKRQFLADLQRPRLEALRAELADFIRKNDYRFAGEGFGPERDSWRRGVRLVTGIRSPAQDV